MKKILLFLSLVFWSSCIVKANLCHEEDFWIKELNESKFLMDSNKEIRNCLLFGTKDLKLDSSLLSIDKNELDRSISTVAKVLRDNSAKVEVINISLYRNDPEVMEIITNKILSSLIYNRTIKRVYLQGLQASSAHLLAEVIANNPIIETLECKESDITDYGITLISEALEKNEDLKVFNLPNNASFELESYNS